MENIDIKKAKLSGRLFLEATYKVRDLVEKTSKEITEKNDTPVHEDLVKTFQQLHKHLPIMCDYVKATKIKPEMFGEAEYTHDWVLDFEVTGFTIGGSDENEGVVLIGNKSLKSGKQVNLITPFIKFSDSEEYKYCHELSSDIYACVYEVKEYLFNKKRAPKAQLSLELEFEGEQEEGEAPAVVVKLIKSKEAENAEL